MSNAWVKDCSCGKCGKCSPGCQAAVEKMFSSHQESGFSGDGGYADNYFKKLAHGDCNVPTHDKSDPPFEGRDAKKGPHGTIQPGTQSKGGIFRG